MLEVPHEGGGVEEVDGGDAQGTQRSRFRGVVHSFLEYQPGLEGAGRAREWPGAFGDASEVESEESCFHLGVS